MKRTVNQNVTPCRHMEGLVQGAAKGELKGIARWYAWAHIHRCSGCRAFLQRLEAATLALRVAKEASVDEDALVRLRRQVSQLAETENDTNKNA